MPDTSKMTPAEYACEASDADYVARFIRDLEDPDKRLITEKPHDWTNWGAKGKAAILSALKNLRGQNA